MNLIEAKIILDYMKFGDEDAIEALNYVRNVAEAVGFAKRNGVKKIRCDFCDGEGEHECECGAEHECHQCGGTGLSKVLKLNNTEVSKDFPVQVLKDAERVLRGEIKL